MQTCTPNTAETRDRTGDLQIFGLTLSQLSYRGLMMPEDVIPGNHFLFGLFRPFKLGAGREGRGRTRTF